MASRGRESIGDVAGMDASVLRTGNATSPVGQPPEPYNADRHSRQGDATAVASTLGARGEAQPDATDAQSEDSGSSASGGIIQRSESIADEDLPRGRLWLDVAGFDPAVLRALAAWSGIPLELLKDAAVFQRAKHECVPLSRGLLTRPEHLCGTRRQRPGQAQHMGAGRGIPARPPSAPATSPDLDDPSNRMVLEGHPGNIDDPAGSTARGTHGQQAAQTVQAGTTSEARLPSEAAAET